MGSKSSLREYHLLVVRVESGFRWEIRYNRHARPIRVSEDVFPSPQTAELAGNDILRTLRLSPSPPV